MPDIEGKLVASRCPHNFPSTEWLWRKSGVCCLQSRQDGTFFTGVGGMSTNFSFVIVYSPNSKRVRRTVPAALPLLSGALACGPGPVPTQVLSKECCHASKLNRFQMMESDFPVGF